MEAARILLFWALITAPVALCLCVAAVLIGVPLYNRLRSVPPEKRMSARRKAAVVLGGTMIITGAVCGGVVFDMQRHRHDFHQCRATWSTWRIPLQEPYEIRMVGDMLHGSIARWQHPEALLNGVLDICIHGSSIAGTTGIRTGKNRQTVHGWFVFDCAGGEVRTFTDRAHFLAACRTAGIDEPPVMHSVRDMWYMHWNILEK